jgi:hypothetical protein
MSGHIFTVEVLSTYTRYEFTSLQGFYGANSFNTKGFTLAPIAHKFCTNYLRNRKHLCRCLAATATIK